MTDIDRNHLRYAYRFALSHSDDEHTKNGAVLVLEDGNIAYGANRFPRGVSTAGRLDRPTKYDYIIHAEQDAIVRCALRGVCSYGATLYAPWVPCLKCAQLIIQAGIVHVIGHHEMHARGNARWDDEIARAVAMLQEADVLYERVAGVVGDCTNLFDGQEWAP